MYNPARFVVKDSALIAELVQNYNFATLIVGSSPTPIISHLPLLFEPNGSNEGRLVGHMAAANSQWKLFSDTQEVTVIFHGPHAYISARWYSPEPDNVPTWNYAVVHMSGIARVIKDEVAAFSEMTRLVKNHDPNWPLALPLKEKNELLAGIRVFEITVTNINAKFKLSQNQPNINRDSVIKNLALSHNQVDRETSQYMQKTH